MDRHRHGDIEGDLTKVKRLLQFYGGRSEKRDTEKGEEWKITRYGMRMGQEVAMRESRDSKGFLSP